MFKLGSTCLVAAVLFASGVASAAEWPNNQMIPNFALTANTGWVLDHAVGVDDLLPPPAGGRGRSRSTRPILMCPTVSARHRPIASPISPIRSCGRG